MDWIISKWNGQQPNVDDIIAAASLAKGAGSDPAIDQLTQQLINLQNSGLDPTSSAYNNKVADILANNAAAFQKVAPQIPVVARGRG